MTRAAVIAMLLSLATGCPPSPAAARLPQRTRAATPTPPAPAAATAADDDPADQGVVLPDERHAAGDHYTLVLDYRIESRVELSAVESIRYDRSQDTSIIVDVLDVDAQGQVTRQRITVVTDETHTALGRDVDRDVSVLAGKTYLVTREPDGWQVTDDRGRTPRRAEVAAVRAEVGRDLTDHAVDPMFRGHRWHQGEQVQLGAEALEVVNRAQHDPRTHFTHYAMELARVDGNLATFAVEVRIDQGTKNGPLTIQLGGTMEFDLTTGQTVRSTLRGPVRGYLGAPVIGQAVFTLRVE